MNTAPLIRRKLVPPRVLESLVKRQKLLTLLSRGLEPDRRLTLVAAGPGYGKSTLVAAYLQECELPWCWYALEESDADLATFVTYLVGAIKARFPQLSDRAMELVRSAPALEPVLQTLVGLLAEELAELAEPGGVLVLDDFHMVGHVPGVLKLTEHLAAYLPDSWQLVLTTREQPALPLALLRARQQLVEIGVRELRFNSLELRELVERLSGVTLSDAEALALVGHTDGWVASVVLAAQAVRGSGEETATLLLREFEAPGALYDYLAQEVFSYQDAAMQAFLVETSLLPQVEPVVCREALGVEDAAARIRTLIATSLLIPLADDGRDAYGYHPSFRRFLQERLAERPEGELQALCARLASYLAESQPEEALSLYARAGDAEHVGALVTRLGEHLLANNQPERLRGLIERLPTALGDRPEVAFYQGELQRLRGEFDQALGLFERSARSKAWRGRAQVHSGAIWLSRGDARCEALLSEGESELAPADIAGRAFAANMRGAWALTNNRSDEAIASYESALAAYRQLDDAVGQAKVLNNLGLCHTRHGRFELALSTYREAIVQSQAAGRHPHPMILNNMASIHCYQGDFKAAWEAAERALDLAQLLTMRREGLFAHLGLAQANAGTGDWRRAEEHFAEARDGAMALQDKATAAKAYAGLAEVALHAHEPLRAKALLEEGLALTGLPLEDPRQGDLAILLGLVHLENGEWDAAEALLERLEEEFGALGYRLRETQVAFYRARLATRRNQPDTAQAHLARAVALAESHGFSHLREQESRLHDAPKGEAAAAPASELPPAIEVACLGDMQVRVGDHLVANKDWRGYKTKLILAYLLAHPAGVTKEQLTDMLYGDIDTTRTATLVLISRLRHALEHDLGKQAPSRFIHFVDGRYTFNFALPYRLDVADLVYHCKRGADESLPAAERRLHHEQAIALYRGPYLAELVTEGAWLEIERERYHRLVQEAYGALIRSYMAEGNDAKTLEVAEANLAFDACCEFAHQVKMGCLARLGQRESAIRHYALMRQVFERELGGPPSPGSERLYRQISEGRDVELPEGVR